MFSFFFPRRCVACVSVVDNPGSNTAFCERCCGIVFPILSPKCPKCALPRESPKGIDELCWRCLADTPAFDACEIPFEYEGAIATSFKRIKFQKCLAAAKPFFDYAASGLTRLPEGRVVLVPSHPFNRWQRGFHPPELFLSAIKRRFGDLDVVDALSRKTRRSSRRDLDRSARLKIAKGAFILKRPVSGPVVLIDDIVTTGATVDAISRVLKKGGATRVHVVAVARKR